MAMKELMNHDLKLITEAHSAPMLSIYLSKENSAVDVKALSGKWKESLTRAEFFLLKDYTKSFVHNFMEPLWSSHVYEVLESLDKGLIVFFSSDSSWYLKVQSSINDLVVVADSFHIKPLIRIKNNESGFFLISMSSKAISVFLETNSHLFRLDTYRNPMILSDTDTNKVKPEDHREFVMQSALEINKTLAAYKLPIILAGVRDHLGHMRKYLDHSMILTESIVGNVERLKRDDIRQKCFEILTPYYYQKEEIAIAELDLAVKKNHAITFIEDIAISAVYGKIRKLFVMENKQLWGSLNKSTGEILISPRQTNSHDDDLLDDISQIVLNKGGEVIVLKNAHKLKGFIAAAVVTDKSHLYDYNQPYSIT